MKIRTAKRACTTELERVIAPSASKRTRTRVQFGNGKVQRLLDELSSQTLLCDELNDLIAHYDSGWFTQMTESLIPPESYPVSTDAERDDFVPTLRRVLPEDLDLDRGCFVVYGVLHVEEDEDDDGQIHAHILGPMSHKNWLLHMPWNIRSRYSFPSQLCDAKNFIYFQLDEPEEETKAFHWFVEPLRSAREQGWQNSVLRLVAPCILDKNNEVDADGSMRLCRHIDLKGSGRIKMIDDQEWNATDQKSTMRVARLFDEILKETFNGQWKDALQGFPCSMTLRIFVSLGTSGQWIEHLDLYLVTNVSVDEIERDSILNNVPEWTQRLKEMRSSPEPEFELFVCIVAPDRAQLHATKHRVRLPVEALRAVVSDARPILYRAAADEPEKHIRAQRQVESGAEFMKRWLAGGKAANAKPAERIRVLE